jgi:hypothetical protein
MPLSSELAAVFSRDLLRAAQQVRAFPGDDSLWRSSPGFSNPAGNLALHLEGNLREYVGRQLGGIPYTRDRPAEFASRGLTRAEVAGRLDAMRSQIVPILASLTPERMADRYPEDVLGTPLTTGQFLFHLLGHLNYHLGQMDCLRRVTTGAGAIPLAGF